MTGSSPEITLVTPVWTDSSRLARFGPELASALADSGLPVDWIIADDGSGPGEISELEQLTTSFHAIHPHVRLFRAKVHLGKGGVVRQAWNTRPNADWFAFVDADGSVSGTDWVRLMHTAINHQSSVLGIRKRTQETVIEESLLRGVFHTAYLQLARTLLGLHSEDPQCGAKILRGDDFRRAAPWLQENGLAFDSELLATLRCQNSTWREIPVNWHEIPGGKVRPWRDAWGMLSALWRIRRRARRMRCLVTMPLAPGRSRS